MPQQFPADFRGGGESRGASRSRQENGGELTNGKFHPSTTHSHITPQQGSPVFNETTKSSHYIEDGRNVPRINETSEKLVKANNYSKDHGASRFHQTKGDKAPIGQSIKITKNHSNLKRNENIVSKISETKVFESRSTEAKFRINQKSSSTVVNRNGISSTGIRAKNTNSIHSSVTPGGLYGSNRSIKVANSSAKDQKASGKSGPTVGCREKSSSEEIATVKSVTGVSLRTSEEKSVDDLNSDPKSKAFDPPGNNSQPYDADSSFEQSDILIRAQKLNQHWERISSSNILPAVSEKEDTQLPPLKLLKTPSAMHELVNRALLSNLAEEPVQIKRRNFVKLPPLSKKKEGDSKLSTQKFIAGRRLYNDRKPVNKPKIPVSKGTTDIKPSNVLKEGKVQLQKHKTGGWK